MNFEHPNEQKNQISSFFDIEFFLWFGATDTSTMMWHRCNRHHNYQQQIQKGLGLFVAVTVTPNVLVSDSAQAHSAHFKKQTNK
jgi:hypothetical protein